MDVKVIASKIDREISTRKSDKFGIKVGGELYKELAKVGKLKKVTFSVSSTCAFSEELPAYNGKYFISHDWELDDDAFMVGVPAS